MRVDGAKVNQRLLKMKDGMMIFLLLCSLSLFLNYGLQYWVLPAGELSVQMEWCESGVRLEIPPCM